MRSISASALTQLQTNLGTEPGIIIEVQWVEGGQRITYGDEDIPVANIKGRILEVSDMDNVINVNSGGQTQQISVTLDDTDGSIKAILDSADIHKRPAWVYQHFDGIPVADKFLVFKGVINTPVEWNEGDRTVRFDIISRIEASEVGFSMEEGNFPGVPEELVGKAWPLCFGTCINVPVLKTKSPRRGLLKTGFGIRDFTLEPRLEQLKRTCCPIIFTQWKMTVESGSAAGWGGGSLVFKPDYRPDPECECRKKAEILALEQEIAAQAPFEINQIEIIDGFKFPQNVLLTLKVNDAEITGRFSGSIFTIVSRRHPQWDELPIPPLRIFGCPVIEPNTSGEPNNVEPGTEPVCIIETGQLGENNGTNPVKSWAYLETYPRSQFFWGEPGTEVFLKGDESIVYVANILESDVLRVSAYRTFPSGVRQLTTVPTAYYTTRISDFNSYEVTEVVMSKALSLRGEGWEDDIYVTLESTIGPNTVDIMTWLIQKYTTLGIDTTSFNSVRTKIDNYPMNFPLLERRELISLLQDMAFQARCSIYLKDDVFFLKYLSEEPTADDTFSVSDILPNSIVLTHSPTEDLVTKFIAEWKRDHALTENNKVILRHNVNRYGMQERTYQFFTFAHQELVQKSATFWLIRLANTWRRVRLQTPLHKLRFEVFDCASLTLAHLSDSPIKTIIEQAQYDSASHSIQFELWTPIRSGERAAYNFAYPAQISAQFLYPDVTAQQFAGGSAPNIQTTPPTGHILGQFTGIQSATLGNSNPCVGPAGTFLGIGSGCFGDRGDRKPSDLDDVKPGVNTHGSDAAIPPSKDPRAAMLEAQRRTEQIRAAQQTQNVSNKEDAEKALNAATGGTGGGSNPTPDGDGQGAGDQTGDEAQKVQDFLNNLPEEPPADGCYATVTVSWCPFVESTTSGGTIAICQGGCSGVDSDCNEQIHTNSQAAAEAIKEAIRAKVLQPAQVGAAWPTAVGISRNMPNDCGEPTEQAIVAYKKAPKMTGRGSGSEGFIGPGNLTGG